MKGSNTNRERMAVQLWKTRPSPWLLSSDREILVAQQVEVNPNLREGYGGPSGLERARKSEDVLTIKVNKIDSKRSLFGEAQNPEKPNYFKTIGLV